MTLIMQITTGENFLNGYYYYNATNIKHFEFKKEQGQITVTKIKKTRSSILK